MPAQTFYWYPMQPIFERHSFLFFFKWDLSKTLRKCVLYSSWVTVTFQPSMTFFIIITSIDRKYTGFELSFWIAPNEIMATHSDCSIDFIGSWYYWIFSSKTRKLLNFWAKKFCSFLFVFLCLLEFYKLRTSFTPALMQWGSWFPKQLSKKP